MKNLVNIGRIFFGILSKYMALGGAIKDLALCGAGIFIAGNLDYKRKGIV